MDSDGTFTSFGCQLQVNAARVNHIWKLKLANFRKFHLDLLDLRALLGFERRQAANKGLPQGSVKHHLGSIGGH